MPITTCANLLWLTIHLRRRSMILNATASDAAASVYMSIGIMGRTRSTRAVSEKRMGSNFSGSAEIKEAEKRTHLNCRSIAELQQVWFVYGRAERLVN